MAYGLDNRGIEVQFPEDILLSPYSPDWLWGLTQSAIQLLPRVLSTKKIGRGVKLTTSTFT
jgi:hypothetical protein